MELKDWAPWIAVAITMSLSILVPVFSQIANNKHNERIQINSHNQRLEEKRNDTYLNFLEKVGAYIVSKDHNNAKDAGASIQKLLPYVTQENRQLLQRLYDDLREFEWDTATETLKIITDKTIAEFKIDS